MSDRSSHPWGSRADDRSLKITRLAGFHPAVFEPKATGRPELAVALIVNGATPSSTLLSGGKVIVCGGRLTVKFRVGFAAAA